MAYRQRGGIGCFGTLVLIGIAAWGLWQGALWVWDAVAPDHGSHDALVAEEQLSEVCHKTYYPDGHERTALPPHPLLLFWVDGSGSPLTLWLTAADEISEDQARRAWSPDPVNVELVGCMERSDDSTKISSCSYEGGGSVPVKAGVYEIVIREIRTRAEMATVQVTGSEYDCPTFRSGHGGTLYALPAADDVYAALRPYVEN
ncbi:hypothetical protein [Actinoplanes sp. NPDC051851]|uniref:hypothetical protein n=1 Tax=Actinoplanes sp. NPDC051851 TaxID=3154753 RepID=UPI00343D0122